MMELDLSEPRPNWIDPLRDDVKHWAGRGVFFGGSSWKYEGWVGQIYSASRYQTRGKFSLRKFETTCLEEYAAFYPFVSGDFSFYTFYGDKYWAELFSHVPPTFQFGFKVPERITTPSFPKHPRYGQYGGQQNQNFLDAELFIREFVDRLTPYRKHVGYLVFEFPQFHGKDFQPDEFLTRLDRFLGALPKSMPYSIELRTKKLLTVEYLAILKKYNVAHCFNSWTRMPSVGEQLDLKPFTADFATARLLLRPGRTYEQAVTMFQPYSEHRDPFPEGYRDTARMISQIKDNLPNSRIYVSVNNRYAGNTHYAIAGIIDELRGSRT